MLLSLRNDFQVVISSSNIRGPFNQDQGIDEYLNPLG